MPTDFEQQLRDGLAARASQISPNPETWTRVQEGIRREQRFRWLLAGAATTAVAAVALLVLPGVLSTPDVGFEPQPPVATQPPGQEGAAPVPDVAPPPVDVVILAEELGIVGPAISQSLGSGQGWQQVAVAPGSTPEDLDVVLAGRCALSHVRATPAGADAGVDLADDGASCPQGPRFSPDGAHLGWVEARDGGGWGLRSIGWDDGPAFARNASFELDLEGLDALSIVEWSWRGPEGPGREGVLHLSGRDTAGVNRLFAVQIAQEADGALSLPAGATPEAFEDGDRRFLGYQRTAAAAWSLELLSTGDISIVRSDEGEQLGVLRVPGDVLDAEGADAAAVWFEVVDEVVILGDGIGRAWWAGWDGTSFSELAPITPGLAVRHGAVLTPAETDDDGQAADDAPDAGEEADGEEEADAGEADPDGIGPEVEATRRALQAAAASGDLENLRPLLPADGFTHSFGDDGDPIAYWRQREAEGEDILGLIERLLGLPAVPVGEDTGMWVWPFAYDRAYESLSSAEHVALEEAIGPEGMAFYAESNEYLYYRIGIDAEGTWRFFVAGD